MRPFRAPWNRQPQSAAEIDRSNPLTAGLEVLVPFHPIWGMRDLVSGAAVTKTGLAASSAVTISGGQLLPLFGASNYADLQQPARITSGTQPVTIAWVQEPRSPSAYNALLNWKISGASNSFAIYQATADAGYYFAIGPRSGGSAQLLYASIGATTSGALDVFVLACRGGLNSTTASDYSLYRNGAAIASSGTTNFGGNSASVFRVGALDSGSDPFEGAIGDLHIWSRALNDAEARSWTQNRFQTLRPSARAIFQAASGSGAIAGTVTESGAAADSSASSLVAQAAASEAGSAIDTASAIRAGAATTTESAAAVDSASASAQSASAVAEVGASSEVATSVLAAIAAVGESASALDAANWSGGALSGSMAEAASASDACGASVTRAGALVETAAATESTSSAWAGSAALTETSAAIDAATGLLVTFAAVTDPASAADAISVADADPDELYPLAGQVQAYPMTGTTSFPLAGQSQTYPLGN